MVIKSSLLIIILFTLELSSQAVYKSQKYKKGMENLVDKNIHVIPSKGYLYSSTQKKNIINKFKLKKYVLKMDNLEQDIFLNNVKFDNEKIMLSKYGHIPKNTLKDLRKYLWENHE